MTEWARFGNPARFEIALRWLDDQEPFEDRPAHGGWSLGEFRLTVGSHVLTRHHRNRAERDDVAWYLLPILEWLAGHWTTLLHEEHFSWRENSSAPAATASFLALRRMITAQDDKGKTAYRNIRDWWSRHALRAADASAAYPDVFFRRLGDDIEISWTARQPSYAPDGYRFALTPGVATLPVADVAAPLWEALAWSMSTAPAVSAADRQSVADLERRIDGIERLPTEKLEESYLTPTLFEKLSEVWRRDWGSDSSVRVPSVPAISRFDDAVLMFGGVSPEIGASDIQQLTALLREQAGGCDSPELGSLLDYGIGAPFTAPFDEGYDLAEDFLDSMTLQDGTSVINVRMLLSRLKVRIEEAMLSTSTIRGVALGGERYAPAIMVNHRSSYNGTEEGRRFTLAHELCHLLYDRSRARRIAHTSGPWAAPGIEKRANAFAAMLLMPRKLLRQLNLSEETSGDAIRASAKSLQVRPTALLEHLYNMNMIGETKRDELRVWFGVPER